jgi:hypothetical protein
MDAVGLAILLKEIEVDCAVIQDAARKARLRLGEETDDRLEACPASGPSSFRRTRCAIYAS